MQLNDKLTAQIEHEKSCIEEGNRRLIEESRRAEAERDELRQRNEREKAELREYQSKLISESELRISQERD